MFRTSFKIAKVWGIPIKIHISLVVLLALVALGVLETGDARVIFGILGLEILVFTSIALHELGHSFVAMRKGCRVREITLLFIGGAAQMEDIPRKPLDEFQMAVAGPAVSVFLGVLLWKVGGLLPLGLIQWPFPLWPSVPMICNEIQFAGVINLCLALFNLLPSFPMDGGRVLRAALTPKLGRLRATLVASRMGKFLAILFGLYAVLPAILGNPEGVPEEGGALASVNWVLLVIAFFIFSAADSEYRMVRMQEASRQNPFAWPLFFGSRDRESESGSDKALISPPPYERGPARKTDIHASDDDNDPFGP